MKFLSPLVHGAMDYIFAALFLFAPTLFGFNGLPATLSTGIAITHLTLAMCTAYPAGLVKAFPFAAHGWFELVGGASIVLSPWVFSFAENVVARNFFLITGTAWLLTWLMSDFVPAEPRVRPGRGE